MQPIQTLRLATVTLLLTAGFPLLPAPDFLLPAVAQTVFENQNRIAEADRLLKQGNQQYQTSQFTAAFQSWQQALTIYRELKDRKGEGVSLGNLGVVYSALGNYAKAIEFYEQRLAIAREIKDREGERIGLNNIGLTLQKQKQSDLAIIFYKQSVNVSETIRDGIRKLSREEQATYTQSIASTYRNLADLLLQQNRVMEAMQVLDLLKVQELQDYLKDIKGNQLTAQGVPLLPQEREIVQAFNQSGNQ
jgi:tetratricopeptide (TPR) repeat protein